MVEDPWGSTIDIDKAEQAMSDNLDAKAIAFVHAETST
jgi:alanine-glyoxylate transaminase/serine-glyoxylate transaminase/serine-pyruvate transaminase